MVEEHQALLGRGELGDEGDPEEGDDRLRAEPCPGPQRKPRERSAPEAGAEAEQKPGAWTETVISRPSRCSRGLPPWPDRYWSPKGRRT